MFSTRIAQINDINTLLQMMDEFYAESNYSLNHHEARQSFSALISNPSLGYVWIASSDGQAVGYIVMTTRFSMEHGGMIADIEDLFVRKQWRRNGVGNNLLSVFYKQCKRQKLLVVCVEVGTENEAAKSLYSQFGLAERTDNRQVFTGKLSDE